MQNMANNGKVEYYVFFTVRTEDGGDTINYDKPVFAAAGASEDELKELGVQAYNDYDARMGICDEGEEADVTEDNVEIHEDNLIEVRVNCNAGSSSNNSNYRNNLQKAKTYDESDFKTLTLIYGIGKKETFTREEMNDLKPSDVIDEEGFQYRGDTIDTITYDPETKNILVKFTPYGQRGGGPAMNVFQPAEDAECALPRKVGGARKTRKARKARKSRKAHRKVRKSRKVRKGSRKHRK